MGWWRGVGLGGSRDIAVDLGTANTLVHVRGRGIALQEPSVVAVDSVGGATLAVGAAAKRMLGRTPPNVVAVRPLKDGVIADFDMAEIMLRHFVRRVHRRRPLLSPTVVMSVPSGVTEVERRALKDAVVRAGAKRVLLIEEAMAAAIGAGIPVSAPTGSMIVDIGGGTSEAAIIALNGVVRARSSRVAGDELDEAIVAFVRQEFNVAIGEPTAEMIKIRVGSAWPLNGDGGEFAARGRDLATGMPTVVRVRVAQIRQAMAEPLSGIVEMVRQTLEDAPPELSGDIMDQGLTLTGGGALLRGLDRLVQHETQMPVQVVDDPLACVARGAGRALEERDRFADTFVRPDGSTA